ncbi:hypothetical protein MA16_Dca001603 [Dendrobium catenatum]|uniref:Uncharacterized protein n=1 Tax=Dendrobium catenatum TaxID=906689 RepID=A0A2I0WMW5_9ASPA|nr:hypothetical protein MA16_Dca001603 [Dendrobium catenatum]
MQIKNVVDSYNSLYEIGCIVPAKIKCMGVPPTYTIGVSCNNSYECLLIEKAILETGNQGPIPTNKCNPTNTTRDR